MQNLSEKLYKWLKSHDNNLVRFKEPIPITILSDEIGANPEDIKNYLKRKMTGLVYHIWPHTYSGRESRSKPYCLRLNGSDTVGLDWENSVIGSIELYFRNHKFQTAREIGSEDHLASLKSNANLSCLKPGINLRDLWALRKKGNDIELYIIEAKGKEAFEFDYYCFAEVLSQVFPVPSEPLTALLGTQRSEGHGLCWKFAHQLYNTWKSNGLNPIIKVAVLVPEWKPDIVWSSGKDERIPGCFYERPLNSFREFMSSGKTDKNTGVYKYQRAFGRVLDHLEKNVNIRSLYNSNAGVCFRLITTKYSDINSEFEVLGLE